MIALAAFCGAQDADGDVATLRLQAPSTIGCFETGQVEIWLDRLPATHPGDAISGRQDPPELVGFQFALRYDPKVLAVESPRDIALNQGLNDLGSSGSEDWGKVSTDIDAAAGSAYAGVVNYSAAAQDGLEAPVFGSGVHPAVQRQPILLGSVTVRGVGAGKSELTLRNDGSVRSVELLVLGGLQYRPVQIDGASVTVEGDCVAQVVAATAEPSPVGTPTSLPTLAVGSPPAGSGPFALPTAEPGCAWEIVRGPIPGSPTHWILRNSCYAAMYLFDDADGRLLAVRGANSPPRDCTATPPTDQEFCDDVRKIREGLTQTAEAGVTQ